MKVKPDMKNFQDALLNELNLSQKWIDHIIEKWKQEASNVQSIDDIQDQITSWKWILSSSPILWETMQLLEYNPACSAYLLTIVYMSRQETDFLDQSEKERERITQRFRRALQRLYYAGLIEAITIDPSEIPEGVRAPTIYISPFANKAHVQRAIDFYKTRDGEYGTKSRKPITDTAKDVTSHNHKVKALTIINKYRENAQMFNFYKCPKRHDEGLIRKQKTNRKSKEALERPKCKECDRELIKIKIDEFMPLIQKSVFDRWDIKS
jgi:hypothetical protein